jgi:ribosomal protein S16
LTDSKNGPKSGKFLEILGHFDARRGEKTEFKMDNIKHWISQGAKLSTTVHNILVEKKVIEGKKINNLPKKSPILSEETKAVLETPTPTPSTPVETSTETVEPEKPVAEEVTV